MQNQAFEPNTNVIDFLTTSFVLETLSMDEKSKQLSKTSQKVWNIFNFNKSVQYSSRQTVKQVLGITSLESYSSRIECVNVKLLRERERERERMCVCVSVCFCNFLAKVFFLIFSIDGA